MEAEYKNIDILQQNTQQNTSRKRNQGAADKLYLTLLVAFGCIFLTLNNEWRIYVEPVQNAGDRLSDIVRRYSAGTEGRQVEAFADDLTALVGDGIFPDNAPEDIVDADDADGENDEEETDREVVYQTVEDDYFADAVFIGDSRIVGMYEYGGLEEISTFYASTGLSVHKLFTSAIVPVEGQKKKITIEEALSGEQFAKVYLMVGINEMGTGTVESFLEKYAECVAHIRELQPDAIIYLQSIMKVTEERSLQGDYITNEGIDSRNEGIAAMADNENIFYLDVNPPVCDETGAMMTGYTYDGVHLKAQYIALWKDFLKCHAVTRTGDL